MSEFFYDEKTDRIIGQTDGAMEYGMITYSLRSKKITEKLQRQFISEGLYSDQDIVGDIYSDSFSEAFEYAENEVYQITFDNTLNSPDDFKGLAEKVLEYAKRLENDTEKDLIVYCY